MKITTFFDGPRDVVAVTRRCRPFAALLDPLLIRFQQKMNVTSIISAVWCTGVGCGCVNNLTIGTYLYRHSFRWVVTFRSVMVDGSFSTVAVLKI
jgi:hypothetical protein